MGITVVWDNEEKTAIRYDFQGDWSWDDFRAAAMQSGAMTGEVDHPVDLIANMLNSAPLPEGAMFQFNRALRNAPQGRGMFVIVAADSWMKALTTVLDRAGGGGRFSLAGTLEEAREMVARRRAQTVQEANAAATQADTETAEEEKESEH